MVLTHQRFAGAPIFALDLQGSIQQQKKVQNESMKNREATVNCIVGFLLTRSEKLVTSRSNSLAL
jgi:hypothetical protein